MRNIILIISVIITCGLFSSCNKEPELPIFTENDYPQIFGVWPESDMESGKVGEINGQLGVEVNIEMMFSPSEFCEGIWYIDGIEYCRGTNFVYTSYYPVTHELKLVVKTPKNETSRIANLIIK